MSIRLGVMSPPHAFAARERWKSFAANVSHPSVSVSFVFGNEVFGEASSEQRRWWRREPSAVVVEGRERLPHVGKVTEKSAAWWLLPAEEGEEWRCKCDDDTLVHLRRLASYLSTLPSLVATFTGFAKWRGWEEDAFLACGGVWGGAPSAEKHLDSTLCRAASGPFVYMAGAMMCMSAPLLLLLRSDPSFSAFLREARRRNDAGSPCASPLACASQPASSRMWHHEDAGIGFNVFRSVLRFRTRLVLASVPGHFNDPFAIGRDAYWDDRAVFVHGVKRRALFAEAAARWNTSRPFAVEGRMLSCGPASEWGWTRTRLGGKAFSPSAHFSVCKWPWAKP